MPPKKTIIVEDQSIKKQRLEREYQKLKREYDKLPVDIAKLRNEFNLIKDNGSIATIINIIDETIEDMVDQQLDMGDQIEELENQLKAAGSTAYL